MLCAEEIYLSFFSHAVRSNAVKMAIGDLEGDSRRCIHSSSLGSSVNDGQLSPSAADCSRLRFSLSGHEASSPSEKYSSNWHPLRETASTPQSLQLSGTNQLASTCPASATVRPARSSHPEFRDEETGAASSTLEAEATGGRPECEDETDSAVGTIASSSDTNEFLQTIPALEVIEMGFPSEVVKTVIHLKVVETGDGYTTSEALLDAVIAYQIAMSDEDIQGSTDNVDRNTSSHNNRQIDYVRQQNLYANDTTLEDDRVIRKKKKGKVKSPRNGRIAVTGNQQQMNDGKHLEGNASAPSKMLAPFLVKEENRKMRSSRLCKICEENEIRIVFLPCGHLVCCSECISLVQNCTVCHRAVKGSVKVFLA